MVMGFLGVMHFSKGLMAGDDSWTIILDSESYFLVAFSSTISWVCMFSWFSSLVVFTSVIDVDSCSLEYFSSSSIYKLTANLGLRSGTSSIDWLKVVMEKSSDNGALCSVVFSASWLLEVSVTNPSANLWVILVTRYWLGALSYPG